MYNPNFPKRQGDENVEVTEHDILGLLPIDLFINSAAARTMLRLVQAQHARLCDYGQKKWGQKYTVWSRTCTLPRQKHQQ